MPGSASDHAALQGRDKDVAGTYNRDQIRAALALTDPAVSSFLDLQTGNVVSITEGGSESGEPGTQRAHYGELW